MVGTVLGGTQPGPSGRERGKLARQRLRMRNEENVWCTVRCAEMVGKSQVLAPLPFRQYAGLWKTDSVVLGELGLHRHGCGSGVVSGSFLNFVRGVPLFFASLLGLVLL